MPEPKMEKVRLVVITDIWKDPDGKSPKVCGDCVHVRKAFTEEIEEEFEDYEKAPDLAFICDVLGGFLQMNVHEELVRQELCIASEVEYDSLLRMANAAPKVPTNVSYSVDTSTRTSTGELGVVVFASSAKSLLGLLEDTSRPVDWSPEDEETIARLVKSLKTLAREHAKR